MSRSITDGDMLVANLNAISTKEETEKKSSELLDNATRLLRELEEFRHYIASKKQVKLVEFRHFRGAVQSELKSLEKHARDPGSIKTAHALRSSNFQFFSSVWNTAKTCTGIIAMKKRFYWLPGKEDLVDGSSGAGALGPKNKQFSADVDIVAQDGAEWVKVSTIPSKRVLYDLAKMGWVNDSSDDSDDGLDWLDDDEESDGLMKQARALVKASRATRVRYRHPQVRMVLTRISRGEVKEVDLVIRKIEGLGIVVHTVDQLGSIPEFNIDLLTKMAVDPFVGFSDVINVDCTMLLAFASDLSHDRNVKEQDWHIEAIRKQIEMEREDQLLPGTLWPACGSRRLVCTTDAAQRMHEIVNLIGTESEKKRTRLLMDREAKDLSSEERIAAFQELSEHEVPRTWQLPVCTVEADVIELRKRIPAEPRVVELVMEGLLPINQSIFLYGWAEGVTTISSNGAVAKKIEATVEENRRQDSDRGPDIWLCTTSRSLLAKEKDRRGYGRAGV